MAPLTFSRNNGIPKAQTSLTDCCGNMAASVGEPIAPNQGREVPEVTLIARRTWNSTKSPVWGAMATYGAQ